MTHIRLKYVNGFRDRHGKRRYYFRRAKQNIPLPGWPGSVEFMAAYQAALAAYQGSLSEPAARIEIGAARTNPGTISDLTVRYLASPAFKHLAPETKRTRRNILDRFRSQHGDKTFVRLERHHLQNMVGKVDVIVVYKVDRLTRSLADFAKLVELFDAHNVSFVSVTQQFNTTKRQWTTTA